MSKQCLMCQLTREVAAYDSNDLRGVLASVFQYIAATLGVHAVDVLLYDAATLTLKHAGGRGFHTRAFETASVHTVLAAPVIRDRRVVLNSDLRKPEWAQSQELVNEGFVTYLGVPLVADDQLKGILEIFQREALNPNALWLETLDEITEHTASALGQILRIRQLSRANADLGSTCDAIVEAWSRSLELRDYEPKGHIQRVTDMPVEFARTMSVAEAELVHVRRGAQLHDIGKLDIPDHILVKTEELTDLEWEIIRRHPVTAYEMLAPIEALHPARDIPYCHHEKWDGTGYPRGIKGEEIPLAARLFALVDTWDTLRSERPYRKAWPENKAREYISERAGKQFDPQLADTFVKLLESGKMAKPKTSNGPLLGRYDEVIIKV